MQQRRRAGQRRREEVFPRSDDTASPSGSIDSRKRPEFEEPRCKIGTWGTRIRHFLDNDHVEIIAATFNVNPTSRSICKPLYGFGNEFHQTTIITVWRIMGNVDPCASRNGTHWILQQYS